MYGGNVLQITSNEGVSDNKPDVASVIWMYESKVSRGFIGFTIRHMITRIYISPNHFIIRIIRSNQVRVRGYVPWVDFHITSKPIVSLSH